MVPVERHFCVWISVLYVAMATVILRHTTYTTMLQRILWQQCAQRPSFINHETDLALTKPEDVSGRGARADSRRAISRSAPCSSVRCSKRPVRATPTKAAAMAPAATHG